jgi:hypothetical protein
LLGKSGYGQAPGSGPGGFAHLLQGVADGGQGFGFARVHQRKIESGFGVYIVVTEIDGTQGRIIPGEVAVLAVLL